MRFDRRISRRSFLAAAGVSAAGGLGLIGGANAPGEVKLAAPFVTPADNQHQGLLAVLRKYFATNIY